MNLLAFLCVGFGGFVGSVVRFLCVSLAFETVAGTVFINVFGSFLLGVFSACVKENMMFLLLGVGFCGGFTTFSAFSLQALQMLQGARYIDFVIYVSLSFVCSIIAVFIGYLCGGLV